MLVGSGKVGQCCCMRSTSTQRLRSGVKAHPSAMPPRGLQPLTRAPKGGPWSRRTRRASCLHHSRPPRVTTTRGGDAPWPRACSTACLPIRGRCVDFLSPQPTWLVAGHSPCVREASSVAQVVACERRRSGVPNALEVFSRTSAGSRLSKGLGCLPDRVPRLIGLRRQRANVSKPEVGLPCLSLIMIFVKPTCSQQHASLAAHRNQDPAVWASGQAARLPCEGCGVGAETVPAPSSHTPTRTVLADGNFRCCVVWSVCSGQLRPPQKPSVPSPSEPPRPLIADH